MKTQSTLSFVQSSELIGTLRKIATEKAFDFYENAKGEAFIFTKQTFAKGDRVYYIPFSSSIDTHFVFIGDVNTGYAEVVAQENISKYSLVSVGRLQGV